MKHQSSEQQSLGQRAGFDVWEDANLAQTGSAPPPVVPAGPVQPRDRGRGPGAPSGLGLRKFRDRLVVPPVIRAWQQPVGTPIPVRAKVTRTRFHADLPTTTVWAYQGSVPGPTIEVRSGRAAYLDWGNELREGPDAARLPFDVVRVPPLPPSGPGLNADFVAAMTPGGRSTSRGTGTDAYPPVPHSEALRGATVVHLHGALTNGHDDGWAHNVAAPGHVTRCTYPNRQEAATLWYHDHAMAVTRYNVHAGLAGFYLIRDANERALRLPSGEYEIPLLIADRNLETGPVPTPSPAAGTPPFSGRLLYKHAGFSLAPDGPVGEIPVTGPFNLVNGKIWPTLPVEPRWYRFRLLNGSGSRIYRLAIHDTTDEQLTPGVAVLPTDPAFAAHRRDAIVVIGTDGGLLPAPDRPSGGVLEIGPGERYDVLVDFAAHRGRTLELRNENGSALNAQPGQADATVLQFVVADRPVRDRFRLPETLNTAYRRYEHLADGTLRIGDRIVPEHEHTWIGVIPPGLRGSLHPEMWELAPVGHDEPSPDHDLIQLTRGDGSVLSLRPVAKLFDDATTIFLPRGCWAVWNIVHLGGPDHPIHIHMTEFQMISRKQWPVPRPGGTVPEFDPVTGSTRSPLPVPAPGRPIDPVTAGSKDTWVVKAGEWVQVLGQFDGASGSFMYHCHILDHEDHTMMRPFVVLPEDLLAFHRGHGGGHH